MIRFLSFSILLWGVAQAAPKSPVPTWTDPERAAKAHRDFLLQGEYSGEIEGKAVGVQAAALDGGRFHVLTYQGGLPGDGWDKGAVEAARLEKADLEELLRDFTRVERSSETEGMEAPDGARILFAGKANEEVEGEVSGGYLWAGSETVNPVGDFQMHLEFRLPYKPARNLSSQDRGNSGIYIYNNYEVQVIDTFGLDFDTENNKVETESLNTQWCGSFYKFKTPDLPMSFPPLRWQTYEIDFTAPRFDGEKKVANARITVTQNGIVIHDDVELPKGTGNGGKRPEKPAGTILFQGHGNPVAFRNVWLVEK